MRDNQLSVFFRNNHFSTIWKNQNQLLVLVSDQGYLDHTSIVFETLTDIDNDSLFTDGYGRIWRKPEAVDSSREFVFQFLIESFFIRIVFLAVI
jgi:hypothetical protein